MYFFSTNDEQKLNEIQRKKLYLADRLIEEIGKALGDTSTTNIRSIKSAIFDIVVLEKLLARLGFTCSLKGELKQVRNSLAHVDERLEKFDFLPTEIEGFKLSHSEAGHQFKTSITLNFQGAVETANVGIPIGGRSSSIKVTSLYGMLDDNFLWVDKQGKQQSTQIDTIKKEYKELLNSIKGTELKR